MAKRRLTEEQKKMIAKNLREWFDVEIEDAKEASKNPAVVEHYFFGYEAAMKKAKQKLLKHRVI